MESKWLSAETLHFPDELAEHEFRMKHRRPQHDQQFNEIAELVELIPDVHNCRTTYELEASGIELVTDEDGTKLGLFMVVEIDGHCQPGAMFTLTRAQKGAAS